jgi:hypothetical protein
MVQDPNRDQELAENKNPDCVEKEQARIEQARAQREWDDEFQLEQERLERTDDYNVYEENCIFNDNEGDW